MITYDPLWKTLEKKGISSYKFINDYKISHGMYDNLKHKGAGRKIG